MRRRPQSAQNLSIQQRKTRDTRDCGLLQRCSRSTSSAAKGPGRCCAVCICIRCRPRSEPRIRTSIRPRRGTTEGHRITEGGVCESPVSAWRCSAARTQGEGCGNLTLNTREPPAQAACTAYLLRITSFGRALTSAEEKSRCGNLTHLRQVSLFFPLALNAQWRYWRE